jgi:outer membrane lipoprotein
MNGHVRVLVLIGQIVLLAACAQSAHQTGVATLDKLVPADLRPELDASISFPALKAAPEKHEGKVIMLGGVVLDSKRLRDQTELEVLELPLNAALAPARDRTRSEGRFLAVQKEFLDPAVYPAGTPITVIGEVKGGTVKPLDGTDYTYPILEIKHITGWRQPQLPDRYHRLAPYPYYADPFYGYYDPFWGRYPYYYPYRFAVPVIPPSPPPAGIPPQFKKR